MSLGSRVTIHGRELERICFRVDIGCACLNDAIIECQKRTGGGISKQLLENGNIILGDGDNCLGLSFVVLVFLSRNGYGLKNMPGDVRPILQALGRLEKRRRTYLALRTLAQSEVL